MMLLIVPQHTPQRESDPRTVRLHRCIANGRCMYPKFIITRCAKSAIPTTCLLHLKTTLTKCVSVLHVFIYIADTDRIESHAFTHTCIPANSSLVWQNEAAHSQSPPIIALIILIVIKFVRAVSALFIMLYFFCSSSPSGYWLLLYISLLYVCVLLLALSIFAYAFIMIAACQSGELMGRTQAEADNPHIMAHIITISQCAAFKASNHYI